MSQKIAKIRNYFDGYEPNEINFGHWLLLLRFKNPFPHKTVPYGCDIF